MRARSALPRPGQVAVLSMLLGAGALTTASPSSASSSPSDAQLAAMPAADLASRLGPLRATAGALDALGARSFAATYTGVRIDANRARVDLLTTSVSDGRRLLAQAARSTGLDQHDVTVVPGAYSKVALDAAAERLARRSPAGTLSSVGPAPDGSGLDVGAGSAAALAAVPAVVSGPNAAVVPVTSRRVSLQRAKVYAVAVPALYSPDGWAAVKWHDTSPFIGGDVLTSSGNGACTAGLAAVRVSTGAPVMVSAGHCFPLGANVYTGAGATWAYGNRLVGNWVGKVTGRSQTWDASLIEGTNDNADESDTTVWKPLTSAGYSYVGDYVCHSGARSASMGHATPCGIKVTNSDLWFSIGGYWARGVEGTDVNGWGSVNGDSGGTVFAVTTTSRQARGMVSSGGADGTVDQRRVDWVEAPDVFRAYGLRLNPKT